MSSATHAGHLGAVYDASTTEEVAALYDGWAATYDADMNRAGYRHPAVGLALFARHAPRGTGPVLDAGCGTGVLGDWLGILGFAPVVGLDLSEGMLAVARARGSYTDLHRLALGSPLPFADGEFASVIAIGVFTTGHVGAEGLPELVRITRPGGVIVMTVKTTLWGQGVGAALSGDPRLGIEEQTEPYVSMPGESGTIPSLAVVARRR
ncbi:class I SAM-dependent methyltransferase [Thalassobaculum sp.]|uniref:class I SAM-dependent DNA methyltransferase n=1 Tax=Thalassobaculum sp. TaxID=2022740 RepID=UPI0032EC6C19